MAETKEYSDAIDKGLEGVVAASTKISAIVGATLTFRGYTIEDLAANSTFEEVTYLLWYGRLPTSKELEQFKKDLGAHMTLEPEYVKIIKQFPNGKDVHPMTWLRSAVSLIAHWDKDANDISPEANARKAIRLTAKMGSIVAAFDRIRNGKDVIAPKPDKNIAYNFLYMLFGKEPDPYHVKVFDTALILHADHEFNASTFTARVTTSSLSDMHAAVTSAIGTLRGPLHGGANEQVMLMLKRIGNMENAEKFIQQALEDKQKVMGFGHRVYKNGDPRAAILRKMSEELGKRRGEEQWYKMSTKIDDVMQSKKGLLPNVDFYSASVYYCLNIPIDIYTPIFAVSRISGWIAHIMEQYSQNRIYRPRGKYVGDNNLKWVPVAERR